MKETVKDFVPVDTSSAAHKLLILLMFRSVMVHVIGTYVFLSRTITSIKSCVTHCFGRRLYSLHIDGDAQNDLQIYILPLISSY